MALAEASESRDMIGSPFTLATLRWYESFVGKIGFLEVDINSVRERCLRTLPLGYSRFPLIRSLS